MADELDDLIDISSQLADKLCTRCGAAALTIEGHSGSTTPHVTVTCKACSAVVLFKNADGRIDLDDI